MPPSDTPSGESAGPSAEGRPSRRGSKRRLLWTLAKVGAAVAAVALMWAHWDEEAFLEWKEEAGPLPFFVALAVLPAVGVPTTPFYVVAGATFPTAVALVGSLVAMVVNLVICYVVSHGPLRRFLVGWLERRDYQLPDLREKGAWRFSMLVKFTPGVPAFVKNYLLGIARVPFAIYMTVSVFASGFYIAGFVLLGESAMERDAGKAGIAIAALALAGVAVWWLRRNKGTGSANREKK